MRGRKIHYRGDNAEGLMCHSGSRAAKIDRSKLQVTNDPERVTCNVCNFQLWADKELAAARQRGERSASE